jgi:Holliday junction resolvase RusA-like endonuclease
MPVESSEVLQFFVRGAPQAKERHRVRVINGQVHSYSPAKTKAWECVVGMCARAAMRGMDVLAVPVDLTAEFVLPIPASWPAWKTQLAMDGTMMPTGRPDVDNLLKAVKDGLTGVLWRDDSLVVSETGHKRFGVESGVRVTVSVISGATGSSVRRKRGAGSG